MQLNYHKTTFWILSQSHKGIKALFYHIANIITSLEKSNVTITVTSFIKCYNPMNIFIIK